jgi:hypothetical protein
LPSSAHAKVRTRTGGQGRKQYVGEQDRGQCLAGSAGTYTSCTRGQGTMLGHAGAQVGATRAIWHVLAAKVARRVVRRAVEWVVRPLASIDLHAHLPGGLDAVLEEVHRSRVGEGLLDVQVEVRVVVRVCVADSARVREVFVAVPARVGLRAATEDESEREKSAWSLVLLTHVPVLVLGLYSTWGGGVHVEGEQRRRDLRGHG